MTFSSNNYLTTIFSMVLLLVSSFSYADTEICRQINASLNVGETIISFLDEYPKLLKDDLDEFADNLSRQESVKIDFDGEHFIGINHSIKPELFSIESESHSILYDLENGKWQPDKESFCALVTEKECVDIFEDYCSGSLVGAVLEINPVVPIDKLDYWFTTDSQFIDHILSNFGNNVRITFEKERIDKKHLYNIVNKGDDGKLHFSWPDGNYIATLSTVEKKIYNFAMFIYPMIVGNRLYIPAVTVPNGTNKPDIYKAELIKKSETRFELDHSRLIALDKKDIGGICTSVQCVDYDGTGVDIPELDIVNKPITNARLKLIDPAEPMQFDLIVE